MSRLALSLHFRPKSDFPITRQLNTPPNFKPGPDSETYKPGNFNILPLECPKLLRTLGFLFQSPFHFEVEINGEVVG
jgi:hypothetical protein